MCYVNMRERDVLARYCAKGQVNHVPGVWDPAWVCGQLLIYEDDLPCFRSAAILAQLLFASFQRRQMSCPAKHALNTPKFMSLCKCISMGRCEPHAALSSDHKPAAIDGSKQHDRCCLQHAV